MNLAYSKLLGNANFVNEEGAQIQAITPDDILTTANEVLAPTNCSTLYYHAKPQGATTTVYSDDL